MKWFKTRQRKCYGNPDTKRANRKRNATEKASKEVWGTNGLMDQYIAKNRIAILKKLDLYDLFFTSDGSEKPPLP